MIYYIRNDVDDLLGFKYNNTVYYYIKNIQDDIIGIIDSNNIIIANYKYDSWGNIISITDNNGNDISNNTNHIANINPFRYRSYYYDTETNLYYLNSRYYNPTWGRFINADGIIGANEDILGYNLYAYCGNNFITSIDDSGYNWLKKVTKIVKKTVTKIQNIVQTVTKKNTITKKTTVKQTSSSQSSKKVSTNNQKSGWVAEANKTYGFSLGSEILGIGIDGEKTVGDDRKIENGKMTCSSITTESFKIAGIGYTKQVESYIDCDTKKSLPIKSNTTNTYSIFGFEKDEDGWSYFFGFDFNLAFLKGGNIKLGYKFRW